MLVLNESQLEIIKHVQENGFAGFSKPNAWIDVCNALVEQGYMTRRNADDWMGDDYIYHLTEKGKAV